MMIMMIVMRARKYNYNYCGAKLELLSPVFLKFIEYGPKATPSIKWPQIIFLAVRRDDCDDDDCDARQEL